MSEDTIRERSRRTLDNALVRYEAGPSLANTVWYGRVLGFRYRIDEAIQVFSEGLVRFPDSFELLRQRAAGRRTSTMALRNGWPCRQDTRSRKRNGWPRGIRQ